MTIKTTGILYQIAKIWRQEPKNLCDIFLGFIGLIFFAGVGLTALVCAHLFVSAPLTYIFLFLLEQAGLHTGVFLPQAIDGPHAFKDVILCALLTDVIAFAIFLNRKSIGRALLKLCNTVQFETR